MSEPARALPLRWGGYGPRYLAGLALIVAGLVCVQGTNANFNLPMGLGSLAHALGWWIVPGSGWRRVVAVGPSLLGVFVLLIGPAGVGILVLPLAAWLFVRQRPARSFLVLVPVVAVGLALRLVFDEYAGMLPALAIEGAVVAAAAWFARGIAGVRRAPSIRPHAANIIEAPGDDPRT